MNREIVEHLRAAVAHIDAVGAQSSALDGGDCLDVLRRASAAFGRVARARPGHGRSSGRIVPN